MAKSKSKSIRESTERISLMIRKDQHQKVIEQGLNLSGLVRDLIDDHFSKHKVTLSLSPETLRVYREVVSNSGADDKDIEPYFREALAEMLNDRIEEMKKIACQLQKKK